MSKKLCPQCSCTDISQDWYAHDQGICFVCNTCGFVGDVEEFRDQTFFDRITQSPEVLAPKFIYESTTCDGDGYVLSGYRSTITAGFWLAKSEAIAATLARLKEVDK